jgi:type IV secretory pathway VirB2 component (pilin)
MARGKITGSQAVCITLLWIVLCCMLLAYSKEIDFRVIFSVAASALIVFIPLYKNLRRRK